MMKSLPLPRQTNAPGAPMGVRQKPGKEMVRNAKQIAQQVHRQRALAILKDDPHSQWLANKPDVLDELGRIDSDHALKVIARRICQLKPSPPQAIEMIRRHREFNKLADELVSTIERYVERQPATTRTEILEAIDTVKGVLGQFGQPTEAGSHQFLKKQAPAPPQKPTDPQFVDKLF